MVWSKLKLMFSKLKIEMTKIFALGKEYEIGGRVKLKPDKIRKIFNWLVLQNQTTVRAFLSTIQSTYQWVLSFTELIPPLTRLIKKIEWR